MKKIIIIALLLLAAIAIYADGADDGNTLEAQARPEGYFMRPALLDSPAAMAILGSTLVYFNYEIISDKNTAYAITCDSVTAAGIVLTKITADDEKSPAAIASRFTLITGLCGMIYYPTYGLVNGYVVKDKGQQVRGWIGLGVMSISYAMLLMERAAPERRIGFYPVFGEKYAGLFVDLKL